ncbi:MAG: low affinity iron permease family protein [Candidatus Eremiobacteraeota bacterium]|nr:low affinity iron permease family protein [Candidatus Eremiobacteraeota bacterium]
MKDWFVQISRGVSNSIAHPAATAACIVAIVAWGLIGPHYHFANQWQTLGNLVPNIIALLLLFVIAGAQRRDTEGLHLKIDALIAANPNVKNAIVGIESATEADVERAKEHISEIVEAVETAEHARS